MRRKIPTPRSGGLILSYKCNAACLHCMYGCSPTWSADWISEEDLRTILQQVAPWIDPGPYGPRSMGLNEGLHFTGGEPFMNFPLLQRAVEIAEELRIPSTFVETNGFWCSDDDTTWRKLHALRDRGMAGIMISVNPFYLEYVPFERTERCIRASLEIFEGTVAVYQPEYYRRFKQWGITGRVPLRQYLERERGEDLFRNVEFFINGRAAYALASRMDGELARYFSRYPARAFFNQACMPPFVREWHNHFDNYGNYMPGYCGGISFGDCRGLDRLLEEGIDSEEYPVLSLLMDEDMRGLVDFARDRGYTENPAGYFSKCHLCADVRKSLAQSNGYKELAPREFYDHLDE